MIGISREDFHNSTKDWMKRIKREDLLKVFPIISTAIKKDQTFIVEFRMKHKNGQYVWIEGSGSTVDFDQEGRPLQVYGIHRDIQFKKEQEKHLKEQEKVIYNQSKIDAISGMLTNIAHQWRQPLSIISTNVSGLQLFINMQKEISEKDINDCANLVMNQTEYLSKTINDFTRLFYSETTNQETTNLYTIIDELQNIIKGNLIEESIQWVVNIQDEIEINTYSSTITHALLNIINNSIDAFNQNNISKDNRFIFIEAYKEKNKLKLKIRDSADGIEKNIINSIFEPYFTTKHQSVGKGLGLYMTYQVITHQLKGTIDAKNISFSYNQTKYNGVEFSMILPL